MGMDAVPPALVASVRSKLATVSEDATLVNNAKLRRRVKRLLETFDEAPQPEQPPRVEPPSKVARREVAAAVVAEPAAAQRTNTVPTGSFPRSLALLDAATEAAEVEQALNDLSVDSEGTDGEKIAFRRRLHAMLESGGSSSSSSSSLISNAKVRRRAKRLLEMLEAKFPPSADQEEKPAKLKKVKQPKYAPDADPNNPPAGPPLEAAIENAKAVIEKTKGVEDLNAILHDVMADSGNCGSRRSLKRLLERIVGTTTLSSAMSAHTRRRVDDVMNLLAPKNNK